MGVRGVECVQIRVRLPLLETAPDLPPKAVEPSHQGAGERRARQIRAEPRHRPVATRDHDHAEADAAVRARKLDVEVLVVSPMLGEHARRPQPRRHGVTALAPCRPHPRVVAVGEAHDERARRHNGRLQHLG